MSWQATAWAAKQRTGSAARKVLLLVLANYADEHGICWPSQETLKVETELSEDTIQRHCKHLVRSGLLKVSRRRRKSGMWAGKIYQLNMRVVTTPQSAADHTAMTTSTTPQALRHKPSLEEPSSKPSSTAPRRKPVEARLQAFQEKQIGDEVIQNRIASRLGPDGWEILMRVSEKELQMLTATERAGNLSDEMLEVFRRGPQRGVA